MADTKKSENYSLPVGGTPARGTLVTNIDTGVVQWYPKKTVFVSTLAGPVQTQSLSANYLESTYNTDTKKWEWKAVNKATDGTTVYSDIRNKSENPSVANQYSTDDSVANEVNTNSLKALNKTIDGKWEDYGVGLTAKRGKLGYTWIRNDNTAPETGLAEGVLNNAPKESFDIEGIPLNETTTRKSYENYYYPETLKDNTNKQDVIRFSLKSIKSGKANTTFGEKTFTKNFEEIAGSVTLPIQPMISDSNTVDWAGLGLGPLGAYGAALSLDIAKSGSVDEAFQSAGGALQASLKKLLDDGGKTGYKQAISLYIAQEAAGIQGLLSRATGAVVNNNLELLFQGPQLRPFNFTFKMSPRSAPEATQVKNIIRFFKQAMSVKNSTTNTFLKSPFVFDIKYLVNGSTEHKSINRIKTCALIGCDVDYTPDGTYMTFNDPDRTMTSYNISLRFMELEPVYESDYFDSKRPITNDEIGY